jgi:2-methylcitrate dehydratase PrpD
MEQELENFKLARFALGAKYEDVGAANIDQLKRHLLDAVGSMIHAGTKPAIQKLLRQLQVMGEGGKCKVPLTEGLPYDRAAQLYTALIRYPDFMDILWVRKPPVIPAITSARYWRPRNSGQRPAKNSWRRWPWLTRSSAGSCWRSR